MSLFNKVNNFQRQSVRFRLITVVFVLILINTNLKAQTNKEKEINPRTASISIIARTSTDSVILRWAPTTAGGWIIANEIGYTIERAVLSPDIPLENSNYVKLNDKALKPLILDEWESLVLSDNKFSVIAAQALYGKYFNPIPLDEGNVSSLKNAADELSNRYSFSLFAADNDAMTAAALGLRFADKDIVKDQKYVYRVYLAEQTDQYTFDTAYIVVDAIPFQKAKSIANLKYESGDGSIKLSWEVRAAFDYSGYYVFRSEDDGANYQKLNDMPLVIISQNNAVEEAQPGFIDTSTVNYKPYKYMLKGVDAFGELSDGAEITAFSKDLNPPTTPYINDPENIVGNKVKISWEMRDAPDDLEGFIVSRSNDPEHGYQLITEEPLSKNTDQFIDDFGDAQEVYYTVAAVDTSGNMSFSVPVLAIRIDTIPPAVPKGLRGKISETGVVTLSWNSEKGADILGYRILYANDPRHEFIPVTGQIYPDTVFVDSIVIETLTRRIYYRIAAVNYKYYNSELSEVLCLKRPDIVPPSEAVFSDVFVTDSSVQLKWYPSTSEDLAKQILMRKIQDKEEWGFVDSLMPKVSSYTDKDIISNTMYEYTIVGIDSAGLSSELAFPVQARPYDTGKRKSVENLIAAYEESNKTVTITWNYTPLEKERTWYVIYKAINEGGFKEYKALKSDVVEFIDSSAKEGKTEYGVVVMTSAGGESEMATVSITIEETR